MERLCCCDVMHSWNMRAFYTAESVCKAWSCTPYALGCCNVRCGIVMTNIRATHANQFIFHRYFTLMLAHCSRSCPRAPAELLPESWAPPHGRRWRTCAYLEIQGWYGYVAVLSHIKYSAVYGPELLKAVNRSGSKTLCLLRAVQCARSSASANKLKMPLIPALWVTLQPDRQLRTVSWLSALHECGDIHLVRVN